MSEAARRLQIVEGVAETISATAARITSPAEFDMFVADLLAVVRLYEGARAEAAAPDNDVKPG